MMKGILFQELSSSLIWKAGWYCVGDTFCNKNVPAAYNHQKMLNITYVKNVSGPDASFIWNQDGYTSLLRVQQFS